MAPKATQAAIISPAAETGSVSDDSVSPPASVHGRQQSFLKALEEASTENKVFPYGISVPFKVRDAVPGDKCASARVFLGEAPSQALKDMCLYLEMDETGSSDDMVDRIVDYFGQLFGAAEAAKESKSSKKLAGQQKLASTATEVASTATPMRARTSSGGAAPAKITADSAASDLKARLTELGKPTYGSRETLFERVQKAEAEAKAEAKADAKAESKAAKEAEAKAAEAKVAAEARKKRAAEEEESSQPSKKAAKSTDKMQKQYCVAGMSIAQQMKMALQASMES